MAILKACKPRKDVLKGDLSDAIFAADFGDLIAGKAPKVYKDCSTFFQNTHPARPLCKIAEVVFGRLADAKEGGATIRLSTGFGGGKTHTLMALWHLGHNIGDPWLGTETLPAAGRPKKVTVGAIDAGKAGFPLFSSHGATKTHSLWGELFYLLGGTEGHKSLGKADDPEASPPESQIESVFPAGPVLLLLDEIVIYMARLSERGQGNLLGFLNSLSAVVSRRKQTVLVVTDPAGQAAYAAEAAKLGGALISAAAKLDEVFGRKMTDFDPIGDESAQVIARRLFESVDRSAAEAASAAYFSLYTRVIQESPGLIPPAAASGDYAKQIVTSYPFHPRLHLTARDRLGALQDFQKSRGVLRLFARIVHEIWESGQDLELISAGEIDWSSPRIQADLLQRINRDSFKAAVMADVVSHAGELDGNASLGIHRRTAAALLLESLPMHSNSGMEPADLTLAILRPDEAGPEPSEALDRLVGVCWHTYPMAGGRGWQFRCDANVIKQIEERRGQISIEDAKSRVCAEAQRYFSGPTFRLTPWPTSARQVPESADLQLVLCDDERTARSVVAYSDDSDPQAPLPRRFQNSILGVTATVAALNNAIERAQRLLATEAIEREYKIGDSGKLMREQLQRIKPELTKQFRVQTYRAFDKIMLAGGASYKLEEQYQVPEEQMLQKPQGQVCLRKFLDSKDLLYQLGDALDADRFLKDILPGAAPLPDMPGVYSARAIHERFLGAPRLRLIPDSAIVRQTILKSVDKGKVVVRLSDSRAFDSHGCVEGPDGKHRRVPNKLTTLALDDSVYVTGSDSPQGVEWVREDSSGYDSGVVKPPTPAPGHTIAISWEKVLEYAKDRSLLTLELVATAPSAAAALTNLVFPLSPDTMTISATTTGELKDGGSIDFAVNDVKPKHPTKPLTIAQTIHNALVEGSTFEVVLMLSFGSAGRTGIDDTLQTLADEAPEEVSPKAVFDEPSGEH